MSILQKITIVWISLLLGGVCIGCVDQAPQAQSEQEQNDSPEPEIDQDVQVDAEIEIDAELPIEVDQQVPEIDMDLSCNEANPCTFGVCEGGECILECEEADDCGGRFEDCRQGVCYNRCFGPGTCFRGGVCLNGICVEEQCSEDSDCPEDRICRGQLCVYPDPCESDDECSSWERCIEGNCENLTECGGDLNCADDEICQNGQCQPTDTCTQNSECPEDQDCIVGRCVPSLCRGNLDCAQGEICEGGECVIPPMQGIDRVLILNTPRSLLIGQTLDLRAVALDNQGQIITTTGFTWSVGSNQSIGQVDQNGRFTAGPQAGTSSVIATWRSQDPANALEVASEPLILPVLAPPPPVEEGWQIRVSNGQTGLALEGASVYVAGERLYTDAQGIATFNPDEDIITFTVMADGFDTVTVSGVQARELYIPLQPLSDDELIAGFTGEIDFSQVRNAGQVEIGLAGGVFNDGISNISVFDLIGQLFFTDVDAGPINATIPLPGGLVLRGNIPVLGDLAIKDRYQVLTRPGFQLGWSFGGRIAITTVLGLLEGNISLGRILSVLFPFFDQFEHGIQVLADLEGYPPVEDSDDLDEDGNRRELVPNYAAFPEVNLTPNQEQNLRLGVNVPPVFDSEGDPVTLVLSGVELIDVGFVPLGLSATQGGGLIPMRMAPPYQGLQVGDYVVLALSARFNNRIPRDISGVTRRFSRLPEEVVLADEFMELPDYSDWEPAFRRLTPQIPQEADLLRISFRGGVGRWVVYVGQDAPEVIRLPYPRDPDTPDLSVGLDVRFDALDLDPGLGLDDLVGEGGIGDLLQIDRFTQRFSRRVDNGR